MPGNLHMESFAEKTIRLALASAGERALERQEDLGSDWAAIVHGAIGLALLDASAAIGDAFRTGLLPGTEELHELAAEPDPDPDSRV